MSNTAGLVAQSGIYRRAVRGADTLPQGTQDPLFTITGTVLLVAIEGEVTTVFQTQANDTKLVANPTVGADTDICAVLNTTAAAVGSHFNITGTFANAMVKSANGAHIAQAGFVVLTAGSLDLSCAASSTGGAKWAALFVPLTTDGNMVATAL
jgi:hypothetical protein